MNKNKTLKYCHKDRVAKTTIDRIERLTKHSEMQTELKQRPRIKDEDASISRRSRAPAECKKKLV